MGFGIRVQLPFSTILGVLPCFGHPKTGPKSRGLSKSKIACLQASRLSVELVLAVAVRVLLTRGCKEDIQAFTWDLDSMYFR